MSRTVRGRHRSVRVFGQRAGAATVAASPFVQPHVTTNQPDRRRVPGPSSPSPSKSSAVAGVEHLAPSIVHNCKVIVKTETRESTHKGLKR